MIVIKKLEGGYWVHATPPNVRSEWKAGSPLSVQEVVENF
jgi:hypothetical protein